MVRAEPFRSGSLGVKGGRETGIWVESELFCRFGIIGENYKRKPEGKLSLKNENCPPGGMEREMEKRKMGNPDRCGLMRLL